MNGTHREHGDVRLFALDNPLDMPVPLHHLFQLGGVKDDAANISPSCGTPRQTD